MSKLDARKSGVVQGRRRDRDPSPRFRRHAHHRQRHLGSAGRQARGASARCSACLISASTSSTPPTFLRARRVEQLIREALHPYRRHADRHQGRVPASRPRRSGRSDGRLSGCGRQALKSCSSSGWSRSGFGSCTASTPRCRATSSSAWSSRCSMTASSVMPA